MALMDLPLTERSGLHVVVVHDGRKVRVLEGAFQPDKNTTDKSRIGRKLLLLLLLLLSLSPLAFGVPVWKAKR